MLREKILRTKHYSLWTNYQYLPYGSYVFDFINKWFDFKRQFKHPPVIKYLLLTWVMFFDYRIWLKICFNQTFSWIHSSPMAISKELTDEQRGTDLSEVTASSACSLNRSSLWGMWLTQTHHPMSEVQQALGQKITQRSEHKRC